MKILTRYIFREFLVPLFYCLAGFISIYVLFELFGSFSRIADSGVGFGVIVRYFCGYLAPYFHYLAPAALMLATLYTMWMFCRHSELIAMRASGVSFLTIASPILVAAVGMALFIVYVNECFVPENAQWAEQLKAARFKGEKIGRADNIVYRNAKDARMWNIDEFEGGDASRLRNVRVCVDRPGGARLLAVFSERAEYLDGEWWFFKPLVQHYDAQGQEIATPSPELDALPVRNFGEFTERPSDFTAQNREWKFCSVAERFRYIATHPELPPEKRQEHRYDTWAQIMAPWACLVITLIAIPAGIASGRQSVFRGILGALGLFFAFYGLVIGLMVVAKCGFCPPVPAAVLPYVIFLGLGIRSFYRHR